ncbi:MAG: hypothetical protein AVDCRST_MAG68-3997, partial [uncultured Gemmatimonadetes bacterium]
VPHLHLLHGRSGDQRGHRRVRGGAHGGVRRGAGAAVGRVPALRALEPGAAGGALGAGGGGGAFLRGCAAARAVGERGAGAAAGRDAAHPGGSGGARRAGGVAVRAGAPAAAVEERAGHGRQLRAAHRGARPVLSVLDPGRPGGARGAGAPRGPPHPGGALAGRSAHRHPPRPSHPLLAAARRPGRPRPPHPRHPPRRAGRRALARTLAPPARRDRAPRALPRHPRRQLVWRVRGQGVGRAVAPDSERLLRRLPARHRIQSGAPGRPRPRLQPARLARDGGLGARRAARQGVHPAEAGWPRRPRPGDGAPRGVRAPGHAGRAPGPGSRLARRRGDRGDRGQAL